MGTKGEGSGGRGGKWGAEGEGSGGRGGRELGAEGEGSGDQVPPCPPPLYWNFMLPFIGLPSDEEDEQLEPVVC